MKDEKGIARLNAAKAERDLKTELMSQMLSFGICEQELIESITISWELDVYSRRVLLEIHPPDISPFPISNEGFLRAHLNGVDEISLSQLMRFLPPGFYRDRLRHIIASVIQGDLLRSPITHRVESPWNSRELIQCRVMAWEIGRTPERNRMQIKGISLTSRIKKQDPNDVDERWASERASSQIWAFPIFRRLLLRGWEYIFMKDGFMKYVYVNPAMSRLTGMEHVQMVGRSDCDLFGTKPEEELEAKGDIHNSHYVFYELTRTINQKPRKFLDVLVPVQIFSGSVWWGMEVWGFSREITESILDESTKSRGVTYQSEPMRKVLLQAELAAKKDSTVLLTGESGSGKDYLAKYIHIHSNRVNGPYVWVNCAAIAPDLAESELFGHEKGSFTGAVGQKRGRLELAEGGTLFLNEIGDLSLPLQAKLLTFLDTKEFTRVGAEKEISVNVRLIAATNKDLEREVEERRFRNDLFYRLNVVCIKLPPLRERKEDIPMLVQDMLDKLKKILNLAYIPSVDPLAMNALCNYSWPGNVRELRNLLERAAILSEGPILFRKDFFPDDIDDATSNVGSQSLPLPTIGSYDDLVNNFKRNVIQDALSRSAGKKAKAARLLEITRGTLYSQMEMLGMDVSKKDT